MRKIPLLLCGVMQSLAECKLIQKGINGAVPSVPLQLVGAIPQLEPPASANRLDRTICMETKASECPSNRQANVAPRTMTERDL